MQVQSSETVTKPEQSKWSLIPQSLTSIFRRGGIRSRFVFGMAILMVLVLWVLSSVIVNHAEARLQEQTYDALRALVTLNAKIIEIGLPKDTLVLTNEALLEGGKKFNLDAESLFRFQALINDITENGIIDFSITDANNNVLLNLDRRKIGIALPKLDITDRPHVYSIKKGRKWQMYANAPILNSQKQSMGWIRLSVNIDRIKEFVDQLQNTLWMIGGIIIAIALLLAWWMNTPLVQTTKILSASAVEAGKGKYKLLELPMPWGFWGKTSLQTRLTVVMALALAFMVIIMQLVALPLERDHVEKSLEDNVVLAMDWIGQILSDTVSTLPADTSIRKFFSPTNLYILSSAIEPEQLQEIGTQVQSNDVAYIAVIDENQSVIIANHNNLLNNNLPAASFTNFEDSTWEGQPIWITAAPIRRGREGPQAGSFQIGVKKARIEAFLSESNTLFQVTGLIAVLAGILLSQLLGGAVTAPVRSLVKGTRQVSEGDLTTKFSTDSNDELAILASAYNQMVVGLQEREWLRDTFGRFVSQEIAEAIRTGRVHLEGENRLISVLFCDIRGFTSRSERKTPAEMVAILNQYIPVVVDAAEKYNGTVNKFGGDSTLVIYGAPYDLPDNAYCAVKSGVELQNKLLDLNARLAEIGEEPIRIGVGISTGIALAGAIGAKTRQEYTVIGSTVNLASRIESLNKEFPEHNILISDQTFHALQDHRTEFEFTDLGEVDIRGKAEPVRIWAVHEKKTLAA